jgi:tRNA C32,U32 (ribose-2'-O)-methylase TrmJ
VAQGSLAAATQPSHRTRMFAAAPVTAIELMLARMEKALTAIGFLAADSPERVMFALRGLLGRARLNARELDILSGIAHQIEWFAGGGRETIEEKRRSGRKIR